MQVQSEAVIDLIGVPFDYCGYRLGARLGPDAVRLAGLAVGLEQLGFECRDLGDLSIDPESTDPGGLRNFDPAFQVYSSLKRRVADSLSGGRTPLVLGGDHSLSMGSVSGALEAYGEDLAVLWIDAHTDLNTPDTSPSGNLHGMVLGALMAESIDPSSLDSKYDLPLVQRQWKAVVEELVGPKPLISARLGWLGVRDVDDGERGRLRRLKGECMATMYDIDRYSLVDVVSRIDAWLRSIGTKHLWISFDVDVLDPFLAPGTGTAVRGGLTYREMHLMGELIYEALSDVGCPYRLAGLDLVETNPLYDTNNETARTAVEWIASLFGKTILGKR